MRIGNNREEILPENLLEGQKSILDNLYKFFELSSNVSLNEINRRVLGVATGLKQKPFHNLKDYSSNAGITFYKKFLEIFKQVDIPISESSNYIHIEKIFQRIIGPSFLYYLVNQKKEQLEREKIYENMYVLENGFLVGEKNSLIYFLDKDNGQEFTGTGFNEIKIIQGRIIAKMNNHWYLLYTGEEKQGLKPTSIASSGFLRIEFSEKTGHLHGSNNSIGSIESGEDLENEISMSKIAA